MGQKTPFLLSSCFVMCLVAVSQGAENACNAICTAIYAPVCGMDGKTYGNVCSATACNTTKVAYEGVCKQGCSKCGSKYKPVCGWDQKTYGNACLANKCGKVGVAYAGKCKKVICKALLCVNTYEPVCGMDGQTYNNTCYITRCNFNKVAYQGTCKKGCKCYTPYKPVCGEDGRTYGSSCLATSCGKTKVAYKGECQPCFCTKEYRPVCGTNGKTYGNKCMARCSRVPVEFHASCDECFKTKGCSRAKSAVCGTNGRTYRNRCVATKCDGAKVANAGECLKSITCAPGSAVAKCTNTCATDTSPCKGKKGLVCNINSCGKPLPLMGTDISSVPICGPVYTNATTNMVVKSCLPPPILDSITCAPGSSTAKCADNCATDSSSCKGKKGLGCQLNPCSKPLPFKGTDISSVPVCGVVYTNTTTDKVVTKC